MYFNLLAHFIPTIPRSGIVQLSSFASFLLRKEVGIGVKPHKT